MKTSTHHIGYGQIEYDENIWTGKRELIVNGQKLTKQKKNLFLLNTENEAPECRVKGSFLTGVTLQVDQDVIELSMPCKWYEYFCSALIFVFVLVWGNAPALCRIIPLVGGAIGGAISGLSACFTLYLMKETKQVGLKLLVWLGMLIGTLLLCFVIAQLILIGFS